MARESSLWSWLSKARVTMGEHLHMQRVENLVASGTPDVEGFVGRYCRSVQEPGEGQFWLELKSHVRPARKDTPIRFPLKGRDAQIEFMRRRWEVGGNAYWLLQVGEGAERTLYLARGELGEALRAGMHEAALAVECVTNGAIFPARTKPDEVIRRAVRNRYRHFI